jgi:replicative DNA helicase
MITESFLNSTFELILCKKPRPLEPALYEQIIYLLTFFQTKMVENGDVPLMVRNKFDLLETICKLIQQGGTTDTALASVMNSERFKQHTDFINATIHNPSVNEKQIAAQTKLIHDMVAWSKLNVTFKRFRDYSDVVWDGSFFSIQEVIAEWIDLVKGASKDVANYELASNTGLISSINTKAPHIDDMLAEVCKKYSVQNVVQSGIPELDRDFLSGGFQPSRLYMMGGTSGIGKSILLLNCAIRAALSKSAEYPEEFRHWYEPGMMPPEQVFLYVTMENYVYETWLRLYCALTQKTKREALRVILTEKNGAALLREEINALFGPFNSSIQIDYFPANTISPATIASLIEKYNRNPKVQCVKAVYVDYLDLLQPDERREFYRLDLGEVTSRLKSIAATYEIPIITATQLNREAYKKAKGSDIGAEMISESMQKLFIADFSAMMTRDMTDKEDSKGAPDDSPVKLLLRVNKNRDGKTGEVPIYMDYPRSRFLTKQEFDEKYRAVVEI